MEYVTGAVWKKQAKRWNHTEKTTRDALVSAFETNTVLLDRG